MMRFFHSNKSVVPSYFGALRSKSARVLARDAISRCGPESRLPRSASVKVATRSTALASVSTPCTGGGSTSWRMPGGGAGKGLGTEALLDACSYCKASCYVVMVCCYDLTVTARSSSCLRSASTDPSPKLIDVARGVPVGVLRSAMPRARTLDHQSDTQGSTCKQ